MSTKSQDNQFYEWLFGRADTPFTFPQLEVPAPDYSVTYCWECDKVTEGFRLCDDCDNRADLEFELRRDIENEERNG